MALKDWKKKTGELLWINDEGGDILTVGKRRENYWEIAKNQRIIYEGFKTKSQALRYARDYMRRN